MNISEKIQENMEKLNYYNESGTLAESVLTYYNCSTEEYRVLCRLLLTIGPTDPGNYRYRGAMIEMIYKMSRKGWPWWERTINQGLKINEIL